MTAGLLDGRTDTVGDADDPGRRPDGGGDGTPGGTAGPPVGTPARLGSAAASIDPRLLTLRAVQRAVWRPSGRVWSFLLLAVLVGCATGAWVATMAPAAPPDYHGVAAGGLMALAGIVPAVLAAVASGRPVTRLDGGRLVLRGLPGFVVLLYGAVWLAAFLVPLLALVETLPWLERSAGIGLGLGLLVLTTLLTPVLFFVLAGRLHPEHSTLLAVHRVACEAPEDRARAALVKDLRDLALSEQKSGDRRAVRHRMAGLATIAAWTDGDVSELAFEELGLVVQAVVGDRDLALEGIHLVRLAAQQSTDAKDLVRQAIKECLDVWTVAVAGPSSPDVSAAAIEAATVIATPPGRDPLPELAMMVLPALTSAPVAAWDRAAADMVRVETHVDFPRLPAGQAASAWAEARRGFKADGFRLLVDRAVHLTAVSPRSDSLRAAIAAAAHVALSNTRGTSLTSKLIGEAVASHRRRGNLPVLLRIARTAVEMEHPQADEGRGVLLAELVRQLPEFTPGEARTLTDAVQPISDAQLLDRCAPALVPRLEALLPVLVGPAARTAGSEHAARQRALVLLVTEVRTAAFARNPSDGAGQARLESVTTRLLQATRSGLLTADPVHLLRMRSASLVHQLAPVDRDAARAVAAPLLPLLLDASTDFGLAWALWWFHESRSAGVPDEAGPHWAADVTTALVALTVRAVPDDPSPLAIPPDDPHAIDDWTRGAGRAAVDALREDLLASRSAAQLDKALRGVLLWAGGVPGNAAQAVLGSAGDRALAALDVLPEDPPSAALEAGDGEQPGATGSAVVVERHRTALRMWAAGVWRQPGEASVSDPSRTTTAGALLAETGASLLADPHNLAVQVLNGLVVGWWEGVALHGHVLEPPALDAVRAVVTAQPALLAAIRWSLRHHPAPPDLLLPMVELFAGDLQTVARMTELSARNPKVLSGMLPRLAGVLSDPAVLRRRDKDLPHVARSLVRLSAFGQNSTHPAVKRSREQIRTMAAALAAAGDAEDARPGAREARGLLTAVVG